MSDKPIEKIIQQCHKGKKKAYKPLYKHYYGYVAAIAIRYAASFEEAEEIANDAFLKVFDKIQKLYNPDVPFKPWLRKVTIHVAIDYLRRNRRGQMMLDMPDINQSLNALHKARLWLQWAMYKQNCESKETGYGS